MTSGPSVTSRSNSFDALRLLGAVLVLVGHGWLLVGREAERPMILGVEVHVVGVAIFFVISGYLIWGSWERTRSPIEYFTARVLRILPALAVVVALTVFVLGPLVSSKDPGEYFTDPQSWDYLRNLYLFQPQYDLPGVFTDNGFSAAVNGSLWTLRAEFLCYLAVPMIALLPRRMQPWLLAAAGLATIVVADAQHLAIGEANLSAVSYLWAFFIAGAFARQLRLERMLRPVPAALVFVVWVAAASAFPNQAEVIAWLPLTYLVLAVGLIPIPVVRRAARFGDLSYGMYLVAFPIQQVLVQFAPDLPVWTSIATVAVLSAAFAWLSWRFVESPAIASRTVVAARLRGFAPRPL